MKKFTVNKLIRHIPTWIESSNTEPVASIFHTEDDLKSISFVKRFIESKDFFQLSISGLHLMAEMDKGRQWYVIGLLEKDLPDLPRWNSKSK